MDEITLLPCPFCGSADCRFAEGEDEDGRFVAVACHGCGAGSSQHYPLKDDARPNAAAAWNQRDNISAHDAWFVILKWLDSFDEEERTFSRYQDDVILDGVMTAAQRRALSAMFPNRNRVTDAL